MFVEGTCEQREVKITGYDSSDTSDSHWFYSRTWGAITNLGQHSGSTGIDRDGINRGERIMVEVINEKRYPVELKSVFFGGSDYQYFKVPGNGTLPQWNDPNSDFDAGHYTIVNAPSIAVDRDKPIIRAGEKVGIFIALNSDFNVNQVPIAIWTSIGEVTTETIIRDHYQPSDDPYTHTSCPYPPRNLSDYWPNYWDTRCAAS